MMAVQSQKVRQAIGIRMAPDEPIGDAQILVEPSALQQQIGHDLLRSAVTQHLHQHLRSPISRPAHR